ncbi:MAG: hypothetical protein QM758_14185 [Armatimonas sp.]
MAYGPHCDCFSPENETDIRLHSTPQDTECAPWQKLLILIDYAAAARWETMDLRAYFSQEDLAQITIFPRSIGKLKSVKRLKFYGSYISRIPPEIGEMTSLEEFYPYSSYTLHWLPYEITRCPNLRDSTISTRALYGNYKFRNPFPRLPEFVPDVMPQVCSVCNGRFNEDGPIQRWISLKIATDVVPLLVHACSHWCIEQLPTPPENYVSKPHRGGPTLEQPPSLI